MSNLSRLAQQGPGGFVLRFALCMLVLPVAYSHVESLLTYSYLWPLSLIAARLLDLCGVPTVLFLYLDDGFCALQMERNLFHVEHDCTGEFWLCIFLVTIMIYPAPWIAKLRGFLLGISSFFAYGVLRVTGLGLIGHLAPSWVGFFHIYLMVVLNLGFLLFLWTFYVNRWAFSVTPKS